MTHTTRQLFVQLAAYLAASCLIWPMHFLDQSTPINWLWLSILASIFAGLFARFSRHPWWLQLIHALLPLAIYVTYFSKIEPHLFLLLFIATLLLYPGAFTDRVPFFRSNTATIKKLHSCFIKNPPSVFFDLGAGIGDVPLLLAPHFPQTDFQCFETSPLAWALGRLRTRRFNNVHWHFSSLWSADLRTADIVYCFLSPEPMPALWLKAQSEMPEGSTLISNSFPIPGAPLTDSLDSGLADDNSARPLYCYCINKRRE